MDEITNEEFLISFLLARVESMLGQYNFDFQRYNRAIEESGDRQRASEESVDTDFFTHNLVLLEGIYNDLPRYREFLSFFNPTQQLIKQFDNLTRSYIDSWVRADFYENLFEELLQSLDSENHLTSIKGELKTILFRRGKEDSKRNKLNRLLQRYYQLLYLLPDERKVLLYALFQTFGGNFGNDGIAKLTLYFYSYVFEWATRRYKLLIEQIADDFLRKKCLHITDADDTKSYIKEYRYNDPKDYLDIREDLVFLSYAMKNKFLAFLFFVYSCSGKSLLYVDWIFSHEESDSFLLKENLAIFLNASHRFVFLESLESILDTKLAYQTSYTKHRKMVREWCAWEMGVFFNRASFCSCYLCSYSCCSVCSWNNYSYHGNSTAMKRSSIVSGRYESSLFLNDLGIMDWSKL